MPRVPSVLQGVRRLYEQRVSGVALAVFRIGYSLVLFGEVAQLYYFRQLSFDPIPYVAPSDIELGPVLLAWLVVIACLAVGLFTRTAAIINYMLTLATFSVFKKLEYHYDYSLVAVNLMFTFMPISARLSLDRQLLRLRRSTAAHTYQPDPTIPSVYHYILLFVAVAFVYTDSIFWKLTSSMWRSGLGVWLPASTPFVTWLDLTPFLNQKLLVKGLGYVTLLYEASFFVLMWFRRLHPYLLFVGLGLHLGISIAFPIPWFGLGFSTAYALLVPSSWYRRAGQWLRGGWLGALGRSWFDAAQRRLEGLRASNATDGAPAAAPSADEAWPFAGERLKALRTRGLALFLIVATFSQLAAIVQSPLVARLMRRAGMGSALQAAAARYTSVTRIVAGITRHGVFMDHHFQGYDHEVAVVYVGRGGREVWLPMLDHNGQASFYDTGRQFVQWTFRVCDPELEQPRVRDGIRNFTAFWARHHGVSLDHARFVVRVKKIDVAKKWERDHLRHQLQKPWLDAGEVRWTKGEFSDDLKPLERL